MDRVCYSLLFLINIYIPFIACKPHNRNSTDHHNPYRKYMRFLGHEDGIHYSQIVPFQWEWERDFAGTKYAHANAPIDMWMRCVDKKLKAHFFVKDTIMKLHDGNIAPTVSSIFKDKKTRFYVFVNSSYSINIDYHVDTGGGYFHLDLSKFADDDFVNIHINDWSHFARFEMSYCQQQKPQGDTRLIVNIYTKYYYDNPRTYNHKYIEGLANQLRYYRCAIPLYKYEILVQKNLVPLFMKNAYIARAAAKGLVHFVIKDSYIPSLYHMPKSQYPGLKDNFYWHYLGENLSVLRHWTRNVRIFFLDPDEFLTFHPSITKPIFNEFLQKHGAILFTRYMSFCVSCLKNGTYPEIQDFSFNKHDYRKNDIITIGKFAVDPNKCGILLVHWMTGGSVPTFEMKPTDMFIAHFENMFRYRWNKPEKELMKGESISDTYPVLKYCDPAQFTHFDPLPPKVYFNRAA